jgi:hypothetical protein
MIKLAARESKAYGGTIAGRIGQAASWTVLGFQYPGQKLIKIWMAAADPSNTRWQRDLGLVQQGRPSVGGTGRTR